MNLQGLNNSVVLSYSITYYSIIAGYRLSFILPRRYSQTINKSKITFDLIRDNLNLLAYINVHYQRPNIVFCLNFRSVFTV